MASLKGAAPTLWAPGPILAINNERNRAFRFCVLGPTAYHGRR